MATGSSGMGKSPLACFRVQERAHAVGGLYQERPDEKGFTDQPLLARLFVTYRPKLLCGSRGPQPKDGLTFGAARCVGGVVMATVVARDGDGKHRPASQLGRIDELPESWTGSVADPANKRLRRGGEAERPRRAARLPRLYARGECTLIM